MWQGSSAFARIAVTVKRTKRNWKQVGGKLGLAGFVPVSADCWIRGTTFTACTIEVPTKCAVVCRGTSWMSEYPIELLIQRTVPDVLCTVLVSDRIDRFVEFIVIVPLRPQRWDCHQKASHSNRQQTIFENKTRSQSCNVDDWTAQVLRDDVYFLYQIFSC